MDDREHERWMRLALSLADEAALRGEVPVGAVVVRGDEILGTGFNTREEHHDPTAHAEVAALREAARASRSWRLDGCRLYVTLEPCAMCAGAMVHARIESCVYGCPDPKGGFLGTLADLSCFPGLNHRFEVVPGVLRDECSDKLQAFFRDLRARKKNGKGERWPSG